MSPSRNSQFARKSSPEIAELLQSGMDAAILPVGATEQHGPHLSVGMDSHLAERLCAEAGETTGVPVLPPLYYGSSMAHSARWPGTLSLSPTTLIAVVCEIGDWLYKTGFRRLFLVNCHVGNRAPLHCALDTLRCRYEGFMIALLNTAELTPAIAQTFASDAQDWHANAAETALMIALEPETVHNDLLAEADDEDRTGGCVFAHPVNRTSRNGVTGKPSLATKEAGEQLYARLLEALVVKIRTGLQEQAPLDQPYCNPANA